MIGTNRTSNRNPLVQLAGLALLIATGCTATPGPIVDPGTGSGSGGADGGVAQQDSGTTVTPAPGADAGTGTGSTATAGSYEQVSAACAAEQLSASKVYYVCDCAGGVAPGCVPGNDSNAGTAAAPLKSAATAISTFNGINGGEAVVFCRGGSFDVTSSLVIYNTHCSKGSPCTMRDYTPSWATASTPAPTFTSKGPGIVFDFGDSSASNHDEGYRVRNLKVDAADADFAFFLHNDVDDVDLCNLEIANGNIGVYSAGAAAPDSTNPGDGANDRITVRGSYIHHSREQGFLGSGRTMNIDSNLFDYAGTNSTMYLHSIYIDYQGTNTHVGNNTILHSTHGPGGTCVGNPIVAHGVQDGLVIENNEIDFEIGEAGGGCWGIAVDAGYGGEHEAFSNVVVRGNRITNPGGIGIGLSSCTNCVVENNLVVQNNKFESSGIQVPDRDVGSEDATIQNVTVRSNTIVGGGAALSGVQLGGQGSGHVVANNTVSRTNAGTLDCFGISNGVTSDYNACFSPSGATWSARDAHGVTVDPQFTGVASGDYLPGSALHNTGNAATASKNDITGAARDSQPDIGAFEAR